MQPDEIAMIKVGGVHEKTEYTTDNSHYCILLMGLLIDYCMIDTDGLHDCTDRHDTDRHDGLHDYCTEH